MIQPNPNIIQQGSKKKPFKVIGVIRGSQESWNKGRLITDWYYLIRYLNNKDCALLHIENNKVVGKITDDDKIREKLTFSN